MIPEQEESRIIHLQDLLIFPYYTFSFIFFFDVEHFYCIKDRGGFRLQVFLCMLIITLGAN